MSSVNHWGHTELIDQSWKRCQKFGLLSTGPISNFLLTGIDLQKVLKENELLIKQTASILEKLNPVIHPHGHVTVIVDRNGTIIYKAGKLDLGNSPDYMSIGSNWSEEIKGTNAIGLAIYEKKPVITHAEHHFYVKNHYLTCAASPIYSPTGEFIGAINISTKKELYNPFMISFVSIAAEAIQNRLLLAHTKQENLLAIKEIELTANLYSFPLLSLDHEKKIIRANQTARLLFGENCIGKEFHNKQGYSVDVLSDQTNKAVRSVVSLHRPNKTKPKGINLYTISDIIGSCDKIVEVKKIVQKAALSTYPVIIYGETGTGKELIAQSLHTAGPRSNKPFIAVNCSAIPESLIESELFGYERGAFTGANREGVPGKFEAAHGGTIFLDEIGDMSLKAQSALLRVLQDKVVTRIGALSGKSIDIRVLTATNKNLLEEVHAGRFREDLYYRLKGLFITLPPLRQRSDIIELTEHLLSRLDNPSLRLSEEAKQLLYSYHWPGNIRELNSVLMQASFHTENDEIQGSVLQLEHGYEREPNSLVYEKLQHNSLINTEIAAIKQVLHSVEWNISKAATILKISRNTLYNKINKYRLVK